MKFHPIKLVSLCLIWILPGIVTPESSDAASKLNKPPRIHPDYTNVLIPPNIAPLNFKLLESADESVLTLSSESGRSVTVKSKNGNFDIPVKKWKSLLAANPGKTLTLEIRIRRGKAWFVFDPVTNRISDVPVDPYMSYRLINPAFSLWTDLGLYQRCVETFEESPILINRLTNDNCMNCHYAKNNDPEFTLMHLRGKPGCTLIQQEGQVKKVNTATDFNKAGAYPAWHPDGKVIVFSVNALSMFFHARGESRDVLDSESNLVMYDIDKNEITASPGIADPDRMETFPCWFPDGKTLYFCAANKLETYFGKRDGREDLLWETIRYDLMRIDWDKETGTWGKPETVLDAKAVNGSITEPRISPDGNFLMFTLADYGNFPIYLKSADLYVMDLRTKQYKPLESNSKATDSFHAFSSRGGWFVFSSKRLDGLCARPYFSYLNDDGTATKPILLPQKDPEFYDTFIKTYNVPELLTGPVNIDPRIFAQTALKGALVQATLDPAIQPQAAQKEETELYKQAKR